MELEYGNRESPVMIVTDFAVERNDHSAFHRDGPLYNGIIIPVKYYLNQYLILNSNMRLISETVAEEPFHYVAAVESPKDRKRELNLVNLRNVLLGVDPLVVLTLGDFAYTCCQLALGKSSETHPGKAKILGEIYRQNMIQLRMHENEGQVVLPILGREYLADHTLGNEFIGEEDPALFISYFHYLGCTLGRLFLDLYSKKQYRWNNLMLKQ